MRAAWVVASLGCALLAAAIVSAAVTPNKPGPNSVRIGAHDEYWICAQYAAGWSCKTAADVRAWLLENAVDPDAGDDPK